MTAANRLAHEKSPYLLQHAKNPVDWYPWGDEAFDRARQEDKPVFLSIGYSTCHWCHVMERESFESPAIAGLLNRDFVSIKVDREEHPDVDQIYMSAVQAMTGRGGWPLTAFLTPERKPFYGGTYFPPERRWDMPGMAELLPAVAKAWREKRGELVSTAERLTGAIAESLTVSAPGAVTEELLHGAFRQAGAAFDRTYGGFGDAPKFPRGHEYAFLLRYWARTGSHDALAMVTFTLERMAAGGLHDHVGGGFHRYSTDAHWLVPHFEKMLYDQGLLASVYLEAYQVTRRELFAETARGIFEYVLRDLTSPEGGFYSAEDADSEGEEGKFYVWTPEQIEAVLGAERAAAFCQAYGVTAAGNFEQLGTSILHLEAPVADAAQARQLAGDRARLLAARSRRIRPHLDDKVLTSWNGLMIAAFAKGAAVLDEPRYARAAGRAASFVLAHLSDGGRLRRRYRDGDARYPGTLEDYAFFVHGLIELFQADADPRWLREAMALGRRMLELFWDAEQGGLFLRGAGEAPLIARSKELYDGATPSGQSVAALDLLRLGQLSGDASLDARGRGVIERCAGLLAQMPSAYPMMLIATDMALGPAQEIVIAGAVQPASAAALLREARRRFLPRAMVVMRNAATRHELDALVPGARGQDPLDGRSAAYVCERFACQRPVTDPAALGELLGRAVSP